MARQVLHQANENETVDVIYHGAEGYYHAKIDPSKLRPNSKSKLRPNSKKRKQSSEGSCRKCKLQKGICNKRGQPAHLPVESASDPNDNDSNGDLSGGASCGDMVENDGVASADAIPDDITYHNPVLATLAPPAASYPPSTAGLDLEETGVEETCSPAVATVVEPPSTVATAAEPPSKQQKRTDDGVPNTTEIIAHLRREFPEAPRDAVDLVAYLTSESMSPPDSGDTKTNMKTKLLFFYNETK